MLTLNQEIEIFKNFSLNHKQLGKGTSQNNFFFGNEWDVEASAKAQYPLMWVSVLPTSVDAQNGTIIRKFQVDISDLVSLDIANQNHVLSDCEQICLDCINYLDFINGNNPNIIMNIGNVSELTDYVEKRDSMVTGWYFTVELRSHQEGTSCYLPIENGTILDSNYIYVGGQYASECGNFVVDIKDQNGNVIQSFSTSGEYIVTVLSGIRDTLTSNVTTITDNII